MKERWKILCGILTLSLVMLSYEILLSRIASVMLTSQYVFFILGISLLGISVGALVEFWWYRKHPGKDEGLVGFGLAAAAILLVAVDWTLLKTGANAGIYTLGMATGLPFAAAGFLFAYLFRVYAQHTALLYAFDLFGAAAGALGVAWLLPLVGPFRAVLLLAAVLLLVSGLFFARRLLKIGFPSLLLSLLFALYLWSLHNPEEIRIPIGQHADKDLYRLQVQYPGEVELVESRWSTFGRTDLVKIASDSTLMSLYIDGAAGANMLRFDGRFDDTSKTFMASVQHFGGMIPLLNLRPEQRDHALIIGPGGGRDVLIALKAGFNHITAVEINPQIVELVRKYEDFNGGIYTRYPNVEVVVAEGRHYLRRSRQKYDLITLFMPITKSSRDLNAFALSENFLFTREAFEEYYDHLSPEGMLLIMAHGMPEAYKIVTTALEALKAKGFSVPEGMKRLYVLGSPVMPLIGMKREPVTEPESAFLHAAAHYTIFDCQYSYIPGVEQSLIRISVSRSVDARIPMMNQMFLDLAKGKISLERLETGTNVNLVPATDDRPFFFHYDFYVPETVSTLFWLSLSAIIVVLLVPGMIFRLNFAGEHLYFSWKLPFYFLAIGMGYLMIELALFHKLLFYLGDPTVSLGLMLAALLVGSGVGSALSQRLHLNGAVWAGVLAGFGAIALWFLLPILFEAAADLSPWWQKGLGAALLVFLGIPMGILFPIGLRTTRLYLSSRAIPWMWALNGVASVFASALTISIAMSFGYTGSLVTAASFYLMASLFMMSILKHEPEQPFIQKELSHA